MNYYTIKDIENMVHPRQVIAVEREGNYLALWLDPPEKRAASIRIKIKNF